MKGVTYLRDAMLQVLVECPQTTITYFGAKDMAGAILPTYPPELHHRVSVVPRFNNSELPRLLADYHILAFPSLSEGFPLSGTRGNGLRSSSCCVRCGGDAFLNRARTERLHCNSQERT